VIKAFLTVRAAVALVATGIVMVAIAAGSAAPVPFHPGDSGRLRLSWSARPERIETCRTLSAKELAGREEHMRQRVECEGHSATYALVVEVDGQPIETTVVRGAGLRHDRPIYLLRDFDIPYGRRHLRVSFTRREAASHGNDASPVAAGSDTGIYAGRAEREIVERSRRKKAAVPAQLVLDTTLMITPRAVTILTFNQERRALEILRETGGGVVRTVEVHDD